MTNFWAPVIVGVDASPEAAKAAALAWELAQAAGTEWHLVLAVRDLSADMTPALLPADAGPQTWQLAELARASVGDALGGTLPDSEVDRLEARLGRPGVVLVDAAERYAAEVIVVGGKHHSALGRWLVGSTVHDLLRTAPVPVLVVGPGGWPPRRVLTAVDLSDAARPTLRAAQRYAELFGAQLLVMHVLAPVPVIVEPGINTGAVIGQEDLDQHSRELFEESVWPLVDYAKADRLVRRGPVVETIHRQVKSWKADLVVAGSHGKGFIDRLLLGSTTQGLVNDLPTSALIVPAALPARARPKRARAPDGAVVPANA